MLLWLFIIFISVTCTFPKKKKKRQQINCHKKIKYLFQSGRVLLLLLSSGEWCNSLAHHVSPVSTDYTPTFLQIHACGACFVHHKWYARSIYLCRFWCALSTHNLLFWWTGRLCTALSHTPKQLQSFDLKKKKGKKYSTYVYSYTSSRHLHLSSVSTTLYIYVLRFIFLNDTKSLHTTPVQLQIVIYGLNTHHAFLLSTLFPLPRVT